MGAITHRASRLPILLATARASGWWGKRRRDCGTEMPCLRGHWVVGRPTRTSSSAAMPLCRAASRAKLQLIPKLFCCRSGVSLRHMGGGAITCVAPVGLYGTDAKETFYLANMVAASFCPGRDFSAQAPHCIEEAVRVVVALLPDVDREYCKAKWVCRGRDDGRGYTPWHTGVTPHPQGPKGSGTDGRARTRVGRCSRIAELSFCLASSSRQLELTEIAQPVAGMGK
jgi:hypothetical protein